MTRHPASARLGDADLAPVAQLGQAAFSVLFTWKLVEAHLGGLDVPSYTWACIPVTFGLWVATYAVPWERSPHWLLGALAVVDIGLIAVAAQGPPGASVVMVLVPAIGLPAVFGRQAVPLAVAAVVLGVTVPTLVRQGPDDLALARGVVAPLAALGAALLTALAREHVLAREQTISHQNQELEAVLDTVDVGLVIIDQAGRLKTINQRQKPFIELVYPDGPPTASGSAGLAFLEDGRTPLRADQTPSVRAVQGEEFDNYVLWLGDDASTRRAAAVSSRIVWDDQGRFNGAVLSFNDVTDLVHALQVKDEFIESVSHELRTPLTSIVGTTEVLLDDETDLGPDLTRQLTVISRNAERLQRLVSDLLLAADPNPARADVEQGATDLAESLRRIVESARTSAARTDVALTLTAPPELPAAMDGEDFAQLATNLVSNAIKYTPPGGAVRVELTRQDDAIKLAVADTGIGISPSDREQLFTRFYRSPEARRRQIGGVGLGLAIVLRATKRYAGRVDVVSEVGAGSTFTVSIPAVAIDP